MTREEIAVKLAKDSAFKQLTPERQKAVFEVSVSRISSTPSTFQAETIGAPTKPTARTFFPASVGLQQASSQHPIISNLPFMRVGAAGLDILRNVGAAINTPLETARTVSEGGGFHPVESYLRELRGGRIEPTIEQERMKDLTNIGVGMVPFGRAIPPVLNRLERLAETTPLPRFPSFRQPRIETVEEVLRVPEARLPKLTQKERIAYFEGRSKQIRQQFTQRGQVLKDEQIALNKELGKAAQQRSLYVRDQLPALYSKQSVHYRNLVDHELAPVANDLIPDAEIRSYLVRRFSKDPERLNAVSSRLGLVNESVAEATGFPPPTYKIGELYQKSLNLGQSLPRSVRESLRTYSATEDATDDAISVIVDVLHERGINLHEARSFWKSWAPIRNQATREFRPFIEPDVTTRSGSQRLIKLAQGMDPDNQVYAKTLSNLLGIDDLPGELKSVVAKLDTAKKSQLSLILQQQEANGSLQAMKFRINQIADRETRRWTTIKWVLGILGAGGGVTGAISVLRQP